MNNTKFEKAREILLEMINQRLYTDICTENKDYISAVDLNGDKFLAFNKIVKDLNIDEIQKFVNIMNEDNINHILIMHINNPTPAVKNVIENAPNIKKFIELFNIDDLQFNITKHILVPEHILLNKEDTKNFKLKFGIDIPVILNSDSVSKFYNFPKGHIIKIMRKNFISYRIVK